MTRSPLRLYDGTIHNVPKGRTQAQNASFQTYDVAIDASYLSKAQRDGKHAKEMYVTELYDEMQKHDPNSRKYLKAEIELQQKFALPMACFIMAFIALPLGTHWKSGRSWGVGIGLVVFLGYYLIFSLSWNLGDTGSYPPHPGSVAAQYPVRTGWSGAFPAGAEGKTLPHPGQHGPAAPAFGHHHPERHRQGVKGPRRTDSRLHGRPAGCGRPSPGPASIRKCIGFTPPGHDP